MDLMTVAPDNSGELSPGDLVTLLTATGRSHLADALCWIAEDRVLSTGAEVSSVLTALVAAADAGVADSQPALRAAVRKALHSTMDTSADLVLTEAIVPPHRYQDALATVARRTPTGSLADITSAAVLAAQAEDPLVVEALGLVAGLSWRDLQARSGAKGVPLPGNPQNTWSPSQVLGAFAIVDDVVCGRVVAQLDGTVATRPVELLLETEVGWDAIESMRLRGVSYGTLLAQRDVGSAWSAHRNRTNVEMSRLMVGRVLVALDGANVGYWSTEGCNPVTRAFLAQRAGTVSKPPGQLSVVTRHDNGAPGYAVLVAVARDGGTARKTAATLLNLPKRLAVPAVVVLFGTGWADRGESDDLVRAYSGRLYTENTLASLARLTRSVSGS